MDFLLSRLKSSLIYQKHLVNFECKRINRAPDAMIFVSLQYSTFIRYFAKADYDRALTLPTMSVLLEKKNLVRHYFCYRYLLHSHRQIFFQAGVQNPVTKTTF